MTDPEDDVWAGERVARWLRQAEGLERQLAPVSEVLFAAARLVPGERVLDVGCGTGPTTRQAAELVGERGAVTGLDVSAAMLEAAATVRVPGGAAPIDWVAADAVAWDPPGPTYDVVLSRFGVMFFSDPAAAFANLAAATVPGGRLALAVWQWRDASDLFAVPLHAVLAARRAAGVGDTPSMPADGGPDDLGAFSLGDVAATTTLLEEAGWSSVRLTPHRLRLTFAGGLDPAAAAEAAVDFGPTRVALEGLDDAVRAAAIAAIRDALAAHVDDQGHVVLDGRIFVVTATRG